MNEAEHGRQSSTDPLPGCWAPVCWWWEGPFSYEWCSWGTHVGKKCYFHTQNTVAVRDVIDESFAGFLRLKALITRVIVRVKGLKAGSFTWANSKSWTVRVTRWVNILSSYQTLETVKTKMSVNSCSLLGLYSCLTVFVNYSSHWTLSFGISFGIVNSIMLSVSWVCWISQRLSTELE